MKVEGKVAKDRAALLKKQDKALKALREKIGKGKVTEESLKQLKRQQETDLANFDKNVSTKVCVH